MRVLILSISALLGAAPLVPLTAATPDDRVAPSQANVWLVKFAEAGALYYDGSIEGLPATAPSRAQGQRKLDAQSAQAVAYRSFLQQRQSEQLQQISSMLGRALDLRHRYDITHSGVAIVASAEEAARIRQMPGVVAVDADAFVDLQTFRGPEFIGAGSIWDGSGTPTGAAGATRGQEIRIGVFDSGANTAHPSFTPMGAECGYAAPEPKTTAYDCSQPGCVGGNPLADASTSGHGVHTSSTAGGNTVPTSATPAPPQQISGVASCAKVFSYKVCTPGCSNSNITAAVNRSLLDQIDVANFSLGPNVNGAPDPWLDSTDRLGLDLLNADVMVAMSAGNTRTAPTQPTQPIGEVKHVGPWVMTVANSSHDVVSKNRVDIAGGPQDLYGLVGTGPAFSGNVTAQVADSSDLGNIEGCTATGAFPANSMTGRIALVRRGTCGFAEKVDNARNAGAIAAIIWNNAAGLPIVMGAQTANTIPSVMVSQDDGTAISTFLDSNPTAQATIAGTTVSTQLPIAGGVLNAGSLRGPNPRFDVTKPDITAPGTNILAASRVGVEYEFMSGTSMSGPHVAGAAALIRKVQPTWTPMEVHSAIMLTANANQKRENATTPADANDVGSGMVDLTKAARAGFVLNETGANMLAANPTSGGQPRNLNIASLRHTACTNSCTFTRTIRNTLSTPASWTITTESNNPAVAISTSPTTVNFNGGVGETATITVTVTMSGNVTSAAPAFGSVLFTEGTSQAPVARITTNILGTGTNILFANGFED